jgi:exodeoxyribonuclease V beta subunit
MMSETFDLNQSTKNLPSLLMISASAGTGKTYTITDLAAKWMLENDQKPESLLMVTFSKDAARELKSKLRGRVKKWLQAIEEVTNGSSENDSDEVPRIGARSVIEELGSDVALARIRSILSSLDEASARTIHSFIGTITKIDSKEQTSANSLVERAVHEELIWRANTQTKTILEALATSGKESALETRISDLDKRMRAAVDKMSSAGEHVILKNEAETGFSDLLTSARKRVDRLREDEGVSTFDGMIADLAEELQDGAEPLTLTLRDQYRLVMIDEFQDTDKVQWEIFRTLFRDEKFGAPTKMVLVGDPKQAIYGFRGGDVEVFRAEQQNIESQPDSDLRLSLLDTNYRSNEPVVAAYNGLFLFANEAGWPLASAVSSSDTPSGEEIPAMVYLPVFAAKDGEGKFEIRRVDQLVTKAQPIIVRDVCNEVVRLLNSGIAAPDIAILCSRTAQLKFIGRELQKRKVLSVNVRVDNVFASDAAWQLRTLLWMLDEPNNPRRVKLLPTIWFELTPSVVESLVTVLGLEGFAGVHRQLLNGKTLRRILGQPQGERNYTDLEHLCELIDMEYPRGTNPLVIRRWLEEMHQEAKKADDESARRRIESDANAVRLTTIHSSKGLEWKHVLVADLHLTAPKVSISTFTNSEGRVIDVSSVTGVEDVELKRIAEVKRIDEARRLIYVALTRGKESVISWIHTQSKDPAPFLELTNHLTSEEWLPQLPDLLEKWKLEFPDVPIELPVVRTIDDEHFREFPDANPVGGEERRIPTYEAPGEVSERKRRWSYSGLGISSLVDSSVEWDAPVVEVAAVKDEDVELDDGTHDDPGRLVFGNLRGASLGLAIHRYFELVVGAPALSDEQKLAYLERAFGEFCILSIPNDMSELLERLMNRPLGEMFGGRSFNDFADSANTSISAEMRFTLPLSSGEQEDRLLEITKLAYEHDPEGQFAEFFKKLLHSPHYASRLAQGYLTGSLDLVVNVGTPESPSMVVVDYKTNGAPVTKKYDPQSLNLEMAKSGYPMQALLYSIALYRFIRSRTNHPKPESLIGGVMYYYVRGALVNANEDDGLMTWRVPESLIVAVSDALDGRKK